MCVFLYLRLLSSICPSGLFMQSKNSIPRDTTVKAGQDGDIYNVSYGLIKKMNTHSFSQADYSKNNLYFSLCFFNRRYMCLLFKGKYQIYFIGCGAIINNFDHEMKMLTKVKYL